MGQAAAVVAVDGVERAGVGLFAVREEDARALAGEAAEVELRGGADAAPRGEDERE